MNKRNIIFSKEYLNRRALVLKNLERYECETKRPRYRLPIKLAVAAAVCVLLTLSVFAVTEFTFFKIFRDDTKTVINVGSGTSEDNNSTAILKDNGGYYTFNSYSEAGGEVPSLIFHRDYLPDYVSDLSDGGIKFGDFDSGTALSFSLVYLGGKNYTYNFGPSAKTETLTLNGHSAVIIKLDETTYFNKILAVYFEEYDVVVDCYLGHAIPDSEIVKLAEGFRLEKTEDPSLAWQITKNNGGVVHSTYLPNSVYLPLETSEIISLGKTVTLSEAIVGSSERDTVDIEVTPMYVAVFDNISALDEKHCDTEKCDLFVDGDGCLVSYPRTRIVRSTDGNSIFGETENVKKKLVCVTLSLKNISDTDVTTCIGSAFNLHVGQGESLCGSYVYNRTPGKYTTAPYPFYYDAGGVEKSAWITEFSAGEEKICTVGFLVDEDMLDISYLLIGNAGDITYSLKLS